MSEEAESASASALGDPSDSSPECALEPSLSPWLAAVQLVEQIIPMDDIQLWLLAAVCFLIGFVSACQPSMQTPRQSGSCRDEVAAALPGVAIITTSGARALPWRAAVMPSCAEPRLRAALLRTTET